ncbi:peptide-methionine (S)-S-oxide reductase MsrA [Nocardia sp. CDC153]|uniref:peptide-methionine (S)-S-oxide reductase MsrA n=1 Tax=Nocardia sp. CDC153 TaxID=3112167 RepID=UPI002DBEDCE3|nr:peptide-methionine (S)-S-oxide reductase MsrA [Nocardia sp. CDC153]MEC3957978.1 peptide-methionine (S)-S-oxide reductase MsrA [Nocardia sp. CDC153]
MSWYDEFVGRLRLPEPTMVTAEQALPGRSEPLVIPEKHYLNGHPLKPPFPADMRLAVVAMGCFWGAEKGYWQLEGVYSTAVGYAGGYTPNPTYEETCSGRTGHTESVLVVFDPRVIDYPGILKQFWENHDPTQGMRQGNDRGTQYRSAVFTFDDEQLEVAEETRGMYQERLTAAGFGDITTEIAPLPDLSAFFYAEGYHQQYLAKNPGGYCPDHGTGIECPIGLGA